MVLADEQQKILDTNILIFTGTWMHNGVSCPTRGDKTLDHVYTYIKDAYKALPLPHLGQSDHISVILLPKY